MSRFIVSMFCVPIMVLGAGFASGQTYPNKPIRVVTGGAGGINDVVARLIAHGLTSSWGQQVIVDNRPTGVIPGEIVSRAQPDGYTLLVTGNSFWILPLIQDVPYDPVRDFSPITLAIQAPNVLVVHPSLPVTSVRELIALAKAKPGDLNYGASGTGSSPHLAAELFKSMAGVNITNIRYKAAGQVLNDLIGGHLHLSFATAPSVADHIKAGRLRALAVTSAQPSALLPGLPTVAAAGLPGYDVVSPQAIFAPARTPVALINRLNQEITQIINRADMREKFLNARIDVVGSSPSQLLDQIRSDIAKMGKVIKDAGIRSK